MLINLSSIDTHQKITSKCRILQQNFHHFRNFPLLPNSPNCRIHVLKCGLQSNCVQNWGIGTENGNGSDRTSHLGQLMYQVGYRKKCRLHFTENGNNKKKSATLMQYEINIRVDICWYFSLNWKSFLENSWFNDAHNFKAFCVKPYLSTN